MLKLKEIEKELEANENRLDNYKGNKEFPEYLRLICKTIELSESFYQLLHLHKEGIKLTKNELQLKFKRQMRKYNFEIDLLRKMIDIKLSELANKPLGTIENLELKQEIIFLNVELISKKQFLVSYELRFEKSISSAE